MSPRPGEEEEAAGALGLGGRQSSGPPSAVGPAECGGRGGSGGTEHPLPLRPRRCPRLLPPPPPPLSPRDKPLLPPCGLLKKLSLKEGAETPRPARRRGSPPRPRTRPGTARRLGGRNGEEGAPPRPESERRPAPHSPSPAAFVLKATPVTASVWPEKGRIRTGSSWGEGAHGQAAGGAGALALPAPQGR